MEDPKDTLNSLKGTFIPDNTDPMKIFSILDQLFKDLDTKDFNAHEKKGGHFPADYIVAVVLYIILFSKHKLLVDTAGLLWNAFADRKLHVQFSATPIFHNISHPQMLEHEVGSIKFLTGNADAAQQYRKLYLKLMQANTSMGKGIAFNTLLDYEKRLIKAHPQLAYIRPVMLTDGLVMLCHTDILDKARANSTAAIAEIVVCLSQLRDIFLGRLNIDSEKIIETRAFVTLAQFLIDARDSSPDFQIPGDLQHIVDKYSYGFDTIDLPHGVIY